MYKKIIYTFENEEELQEVKDECTEKMCRDCKYREICTESNVYWEFKGKITTVPHCM